MPGRVDEHVPARVMLRLHQRCAEPNCGCRGCFQIRRGGQVEVDYRGARPFWRGVRRHSLRDKDDVSCSDADGASAGPQDLALKELLIERPKFAGVSAIERYSSNSEGDHEQILVIHSGVAVHRQFRSTHDHALHAAMSGWCRCAA
jgi:hypothetical protein